MKQLIKIEEAFQLVLAVYLNSFLPFDWWVYWACFLLPDISMLGYIINTKIGAISYNFFHHKAVAIACYCLGIYFVSNELQFIGLLLFGHSAFDRMLGYGLKYPDDFKHTHLGWIGKKENQM